MPWLGSLFGSFMVNWVLSLKREWRASYSRRKRDGCTVNAAAKVMGGVNVRIPFYQVDAFANKVFEENPAAVCILESWLDDKTLQGMAAENNLSETAFLVPQSDGSFELRWFTPTMEVDLCGHASLASAFVIFSFIDIGLSSVDFKTASGLLRVSNSGDLLSMDFPARRPVPIQSPAL
jgi:PhzF family phenazine biosynthesis protein